MRVLPCTYDPVIPEAGGMNFSRKLHLCRVERLRIASARLIILSIRAEGAVDRALAGQNAAARAQADQPGGVNPKVLDLPAVVVFEPDTSGRD